MTLPGITVADRKARYILVMGVSGAGKSTIGQALAEKIGGCFVEADDFHPAESIRRMSDRKPLTDAHRWPWLQMVAESAITAMERTGGPVVIACSALKRSYRDVLRQMLSPLSIIHLSGPMELIRARLAERQTHFMPVELLDSQLATLEPPRADEKAAALSINGSQAQIVARAVQLVGPGPAEEA